MAPGCFQAPPVFEFVHKEQDFYTRVIAFCRDGKTIQSYQFNRCACWCWVHCLIREKVAVSSPITDADLRNVPSVQERVAPVLPADPLPPGDTGHAHEEQPACPLPRTGWHQLGQRAHDE